MFRSKRQNPRYGVQFPLTSMIDIVFLLLIYFLLTTNFIAEEGIRINLPKAQAFAPLAEADLTIQIDTAGNIYLKEKIVKIPALMKHLSTAMSRPSPPPVIVKADRAVIVDKVVEVMDAAKAAGAERLLLATDRGF